MHDEVMNELIIELIKLNNKLNLERKNSNAKLVLAGVRDDRDPIIDKIIVEADMYRQVNIQARKMSKYYFETYGNDVDFTYFVEQLIRILLKNFKLFDDVKEPRAFMIDYLFKQKVGTFDNRIWAYFNRYSLKYFEPFKNHKSYEQLLDNQIYNKDDIDFYNSNKFYIDYYESGVNSKDTRDLIKNDDIEEEDKEWYEDDSILSIVDDDESHSIFKNQVITSFDIPYAKFRADNIALSDEEYEKAINIIRDRKLKKWQIYNAESGFLPHDITEYRAGGKYYRVRNNSKPDYIHVVCKSEEFDFTQIFFDKKAETYLRNIIIRLLSKPQQSLIDYLYYQMIPVNEIVERLGFSSRNALNKEKSRSLGILKRQILRDYDYIMQEYEETKLDYWARRIKQRHENRYAKKEEKMLSI